MIQCGQSDIQATTAVQISLPELKIEQWEEVLAKTPLEKIPDIKSAIIDEVEVGICVLNHMGSVTMTNAEFYRQSKLYQVFDVSPNSKLSLSMWTSCDHIEFLVGKSLRQCQSKRYRQKRAILIPAVDPSIILRIEIVSGCGRDVGSGRTFDGSDFSVEIRLVGIWVEPKDTDAAARSNTGCAVSDPVFRDFWLRGNLRARNHWNTLMRLAAGLSSGEENSRELGKVGGAHGAPPDV